ncbi:hypothetical protein CTS44_04188 [Comamonas thiooxydans]|nr:hypothetical protein CTS44_04188 [Comamonas thiooxydans]
MMDDNCLESAIKDTCLVGYLRTDEGTKMRKIFYTELLHTSISFEP